MPPKASSAERVLILTLALERSLFHDDWTLAGQLLKERDQALDHATCETTADKLKLAEAAKIEQRCLAMLRSMKAGITQGIQRSFQTRRMSSAYRFSHSPSGMDEGL